MSDGKVISIVNKTNKPNSTTYTRPDCIEITPAYLATLQAPPFQRPLRVNDKVRALAEKLKKDGGVFPGVLHIGTFQKAYYIVDGQHRSEAFKLSGLEVGYSDVVFHVYDSMAEMARDYVELNGKLVVQRPDDNLRALEQYIPGMQALRAKCPYVGYDMVRRGANAPVLSMSTCIRSWFGSAPEVPSNGGNSALALAEQLTVDESKTLATFLDLSVQAWGRDPENNRLWSALNLSLCMWLYRRLVITPYSPRIVKMTGDEFKKCLMSLSASTNYVDWLLGRHLSERDRSPAYNRIRALFVKRIEAETNRRIVMPSPAWATHGGRKYLTEKF